jgi:hypothetical protein
MKHRDNFTFIFFIFYCCFFCQAITDFWLVLLGIRKANCSSLDLEGQITAWLEASKLYHICVAVKLEAWIRPWYRLPPIPTDVCDLSRGEWRASGLYCSLPGSPNETLRNFKLSRSLVVLCEFRKFMDLNGNHPCQSQWPRCLRHELSSPTQTLESWVPIPLKSWISACVYSVLVLFYVGSGLATSWSFVQEFLPIVYRIKKLKKRPNPKGLQSHRGGKMKITQYFRHVHAFIAINIPQTAGPIKHCVAHLDDIFSIFLFYLFS